MFRDELSACNRHGSTEEKTNVNNPKDNQNDRKTIILIEKIKK